MAGDGFDGRTLEQSTRRNGFLPIQTSRQEKEHGKEITMKSQQPTRQPTSSWSFVQGSLWKAGFVGSLLLAGVAGAVVAGTSEDERGKPAIASNERQLLPVPDLAEQLSNTLRPSPRPFNHPSSVSPQLDRLVLCRATRSPTSLGLSSSLPKYPRKHRCKRDRVRALSLAKMATS